MNNQPHSRRPVIAITGSAGKTTTKEMLASILKTRWNVFKSIGNMNFYNHTMKYKKQIMPQHRAVVLEYGMSGAGHIKRHCQVIKPNIGIITNIGTAHIGSFGGDIRKLAAAKSELILYMKQTGLLVLNRDDANSKLLITRDFKGKILYVGINQPANYRAKAVHYAPGGMSFKVPLNGRDEPFFIPIYGIHHVYNALAAIAVAHRLGFSPANMRLGLHRYQRPIRRLQVHRLSRGIVVIDDSYSANPNAAKAALDVLAHLGKGQKVAVLGTMLGMGRYSLKGHRDVGKHVASKPIHRLYTFGAAAKPMGTAAVEAGMAASSVRNFVNRSALHHQLRLVVRPQTVILVKGSHALNMKETVAYLLNQYRGRKG